MGVIMNKNWNRIYKNNIRLDNIFIEKYKDTTDYYKKNSIEFLVELGEFVNETKCFKYWTVKTPDMEKVLDEFADAITMILYFFNVLKLDLDDIQEHYDSNNILDVINNTYLLGTNLISNCDEKLVRQILGNLIHISKLLNIKEDEIINAIDKKHKIIESRLNSEY